MSEWKEGILSDIAQILMGQSPAGDTCNDIGNGMPLLNGPTEFGVRYPKPVQFTTDPKKIGKKNDILFCVRGSTTGRMNWSDQEYALGRGLAGIRHKNGEQYKYFVRGIIDFNLPGLLASATGSTFPNVSKDQLEGLDVLIPPLKEQKSIASVLSSLDDKIDLLHRQNKTLEAMAETLFRQWFVEEAREDWEDSTLEDIAVNIRDSISASNINADCNYVGLEHIDRRKITLLQSGVGSDVTSNKYKFKKLDVLFGKLRPYFHKVCFAPFDGICSTDILVIRPKKEELFAFCLFAFFQDEVVEFANLGSGGTRMPRTDWGALKAYPIRIPDAEAINRFNKVAIPSINKILLNLEQINALGSLRDGLLPKLMSGDVRVAENKKRG